MDKIFGIIGGDLRIINLAQILSNEGYLVYTYGLEKYEFKEQNIIQVKSIDEIVDKCENIISSIPFSKDGFKVYAELAKDEIYINNLINKIKNKTLITGAVNKNIKSICERENVKLIDLLEIEELTILNVIPTVEGAIKVAIEETNITLNNSKILILGFGRIGKLLAKVLSSFGTKVYCEARKQSDIAWIKAYGYNYIHIDDLDKELENNFDIIFNTIPHLILDKERLNIINKYNPLIIELASKPFGVDFEETKKLGIKAIKAQGLPGKVAPLTSAINIKNIIEKVIV